jgi:2-polyprenyl-6-methoxyphenol hydroxylase-like FAD-dependent oxidoreductase
MSADETRAWCETEFQAELDGAPLLSNQSHWAVFRIVTNRRWTARRMVLVGDAMRTVHFSIGSGTRSALEDAAALFQALVCTAALDEGLDLYERTRQDEMAVLLNVARRSAAWYEHMREKMALSPMSFAFDYLMRGGEITELRLRERAPRFMQAYDADAISVKAGRPSC